MTLEMVRGVNRWTVLGGILIAAVIGGLGALAVLAESLQPEPQHPETLCPIDRRTPHTALVVDRTDALTARQAVWLVREMRVLKDHLEIGERLSVYLIDGKTFDDPKPVFSVCRPEDGSNASELTQNPRRLKAKFEKRFAEPLEALAESLRQPVEAPSTPIFETVRGIVERLEFSEAVGHRRLIIVSDLLANTGGYSHYRSGPDFERFRKTTYAQQVLTDLSGIELRFVYLSNPTAAHRQTDKHLQFWQRWAVEMGGQVAKVDRL